MPALSDAKSSTGRRVAVSSPIAGTNGKGKNEVETEPTVQSFCKGLSATKTRAVVSTVSEIQHLREQIVLNMLEIGKRFGNLRDILGPERFSQFMREILPNLGISRSTGYRWLAAVGKLDLVFPNPLVRQQLMLLTDGKGIITNSGIAPEGNSATVALTAAAGVALKALPPAPTSHKASAESEQWVRQFLKATAKARAEIRVSGRNMYRDRHAIIRTFNRFITVYGSQAGKEICNRLGNILEGASDTNGAKAIIPESQFRTGMLARANP